MVKFGGHIEAFREGDNRGTHLYLVPYNVIKALLFKSLKPEPDQPQEPSPMFLKAWEEALEYAQEDSRKARHQLWSHIFETISSHRQEKTPEESDDNDYHATSVRIRGAHPGNALKAFVEQTHPDVAHDLLTRMSQVLRAASVNTEALRKLVKKHDKHSHNTQYSARLLPILYTSDLYSSQNMLQDGVALLRDLLEAEDQDSYFLSSSTMMIRNDSEAQHKQQVAVRMEELNWLKRLVTSIKDTLLPKLVAHRGFHHIQDRNDKRPLENSLSAYELAWTSGIHLCECDIAITKDEKLVLAHDENFFRLALDANDTNSHRHVSDLTFRELLSMPLKSGIRPPLLIDVLRSACAISEHSQLVIEIKPGNESAASALARLLIRHPDLRQAVAMIMSFDAVTMHRLRAEWTIAERSESMNNLLVPSGTLSPSESQAGMHHRVTSFDHFGTMGLHRRIASSDKLHSSIGLSLSEMNLDQSDKRQDNQKTIAQQKKPYLPKLMLLTVADPPNVLCEQQVSVEDLSPIDHWLTTSEGTCLDGVYLQYEERMKTAEGAEALRRLSERYLVGIWSHSGKDPDDLATFQWLVEEGNCTFVNTDLPNHFRSDVSVRERNN